MPAAGQSLHEETDFAITEFHVSSSLLVILFIVVLVGVLYNFLYLQDEIEEKTKQIADLNKTLEKLKNN